MITKLFNTISAQRDEQRRARRYRDLIRQEAAIGGQLFGPIAKNGRREFFCLDRRTWVWHEEWIDQAGTHHAMTTRYDVRPNGVFKAQDGQPYRPLSPQEAKHLRAAASLYNEKVRQAVYGLPN